MFENSRNLEKPKNYTPGEIRDIINDHPLVSREEVFVRDEKLIKTETDFKNRDDKYQQEALSQPIISEFELKQKQKKFKDLHLELEAISEPVAVDSNQTFVQKTEEFTRLFWEISIQMLRLETQKEAAKVDTEIPTDDIKFEPFEQRYLPIDGSLQPQVYNDWLGKDIGEIDKIAKPDEKDELGKLRQKKQHLKIVQKSKQLVSAFFYGLVKGPERIAFLEKWKLLAQEGKRRGLI